MPEGREGHRHPPPCLGMNGEVPPSVAMLRELSADQVCATTGASLDQRHLHDHPHRERERDQWRERERGKRWRERGW